MKVTTRKAVATDLPKIVLLLASDSLTGKREEYTTPVLQAYQQAFDEIAADANNFLMVAEINGEVVGTLQITFIPYLTCRGGKRALVEAVFVDENYRGQGIGRKMMQDVIARAKKQRCTMVELTTNKARPRAHHFYESLGFKGTHTGMKLQL